MIYLFRSRIFLYDVLAGFTQYECYLS